MSEDLAPGLVDAITRIAQAAVSLDSSTEKKWRKVESLVGRSNILTPPDDNIDPSSPSYVFKDLLDASTETKRHECTSEQTVIGAQDDDEAGMDNVHDAVEASPKLPAHDRPLRISKHVLVFGHAERDITCSSADNFASDNILDMEEWGELLGNFDGEGWPGISNSMVTNTVG
ncbi:hypothetical protein MMC08_002329 [Hypocenomyce scalaris]|nr:hypothetical protein [Hypocenomyce scalaris]